MVFLWNVNKIDLFFVGNNLKNIYVAKEDISGIKFYDNLASSCIKESFSKKVNKF